MFLISSKRVLVGLAGVGLLAAGVAVPAAAAGSTPVPSAARTVSDASWEGFTWGSNSDGRLGSGSLDDSAAAPIPTGVGDNSSDRWIAIDAGYNHTCGLGTDGLAYCWGVNNDGQLGDGTTDDDSLPGAVNSNDHWKAISAGGGFLSGLASHSCGLTTSGAALCWGANSQGQLGIPPSADQPNPQAVAGGFSWKTISAGGDHTCAIAVDDSAYCWGDNNSGQLGLGVITDFEDSPMLVGGGHTWRAISAGNDYTCGVATDGAAYCWGRNGNGQVGDGTTTNRAAPSAVAGGPATWLAVSASDIATCGVGGDSAAYCWGVNTYGELGNGATDDTDVPVAVAAPMDAGVIAVETSSNNETTCGITTTGAYCWGYNSGNSLGNPDYPLPPDTYVLPMAIASTWQSPGMVPKSLSMGGDFSMLLVGAAAPAPAPAPSALAPSPPRAVEAVAGRASTEVSWLSPDSSGSYPVTHYLATASPGGRTCLITAPALTCTVEGLTNGTAYTFTVKALNGAGWSAASEPSNAVVPRADAGPSVVIAGSRDGKRIIVSGTTTGFGMGGTLRPWVRIAGQKSFTEGAATILVSMDGTFEWSRRSGKRTSVYVDTPDGSVRSNTVTIPAR
jgi:hypothetical protein